jgi:hypothetical protein
MGTGLRSVILALAVSIGACASISNDTPQARWGKFHDEIMTQRSAGKLTPVQAQVDLWTKHRELFGDDAATNGFYAYSVKLMSAVEEGKLPLDEAQALVDAREREVVARRVADLERSQRYDAYGNPP